MSELFAPTHPLFLCARSIRAYRYSRYVLIDAVDTIVICEQVGEAAHGKGLTERKVVEIITPGTAVEAEYLAH